MIKCQSASRHVRRIAAFGMIGPTSYLRLSSPDGSLVTGGSPSNVSVGKFIQRFFAVKCVTSFDWPPAFAVSIKRVLIHLSFSVILKVRERR
jgi:hypothetical protein